MILFLVVALLIAVLIPGVGKIFNGSRRWFSLGFISVQASEIAKVGTIIFYAGYLSRHVESLRLNLLGFLKPLLVLALILSLLVLEPDFGGAVVIGITLLALLFIAGAHLFYLFLVIALGILLIILAINMEEYRLDRVVAYLNPWDKQYSTGYQLTQSLIAFGRGEWFGVGLGGSVQKLLYLPESHTDFIVAIIAEEFGFIGLTTILIVFTSLIIQIFFLGKSVLTQGKVFEGYYCFGVGFLFATQVIINIGVAAGLLPTKGLTLPFISYGGSSLLASCLLIGLIIRIYYERYQLNTEQFSKKGVIDD